MSCHQTFCPGPFLSPDATLPPSHFHHPATSGHQAVAHMPLHVPRFASSSGSQTLSLGCLATSPTRAQASGVPTPPQVNPFSPCRPGPQPRATPVLCPPSAAAAGHPLVACSSAPTVCTAPSALRHSPRTSLPRKTGISGQVGKRFS